MVTKLLDDASLPNDGPGLEAEIAEAEQRMAACRQEIVKLMAEEEADADLSHAGAIHELKQRLMMLRYQKDLRLARLGRLSLEDLSE